MPPPFTKEDPLIRRLVSEPLNLPGRLAKALARYPELCQKLLSVRFELLKEHNKADIMSIDEEVIKYLERTKNKQLYALWEPVRDRLLDFCEFGVTGPVETIAAIILAGAATRRTDIPVDKLRTDLHPTLMNECTKSRIPGQPASMHPMALCYDTLKISTHTPVLFGKIGEILANKPSPIKLRLGKELSTLELANIEEYRQKFFVKTQQNTRSGNRQGQLSHDITPLPTLSAPDKVQLRLETAHCDHQQESMGPDEVFWVNYFTRVANLQVLYQQIDQAIKSGTLGRVILDSQPEMLTNLTECLPFTTGHTETLNHTLGEVDLVQGFGPWHCQVVCYEDDNQEYEAVKEVLDQIGDCADTIQQGAQIVVAVSGPSVVGAGAAVVASMAWTVGVCADVGSAVVSIVNFFDENDYLGSRTFDGQADYLRDPPGYLPFPIADMGLYTIKVAESRQGTEDVTRNWEVQATYGKGKSKTHTAGTAPGISEDFNTEFQMDCDTDLLTAWGVDHDCLDEGWDDDRGHGEWKFGPHLAIDKRTVTGQIHVGQKGYGEIKDTPWAQGIGLLGPL